ncbi:DUF1707 domain-containing protein [Streptomyces sp. AJS327]|uniref:DUF1707 SHOCT-like domain-containing protein n=1 Tax=Streptomyces sp. AJS327 TaxID=2545265 RepID=UPI0015DEA211|nr:DUF1707 domain-containing protein [Streptomyces sp. AJS327]MBA0052256.1 DUF1707 domain-containing protein [Streptomyces sp. AJS327]
MTHDVPQTRASDSEREEIAELLRTAVEDGRLDAGEFRDRLDTAYAARTRGELDALVGDLSPASASAPSAPVADADPPHPTSGRSSGFGLGLFGGFSRRGGWTVPQVFTGVALMGGGLIDLRDARHTRGEVRVRCVALCGGIEVLVPPRAELRVRGVGVMGGFGTSQEGTPEPGAPCVVVTGLALWGGVSVRRKARRDDAARLDGADNERPAA